jgi:hypothetical protein
MTISVEEAKRQLSNLDNPTKNDVLGILEQVSYAAEGQASDNVTTFFWGGDLASVGWGEFTNPNNILNMIV